VFGEICTDEYVYGVCDRVCPEAPALVFTRTDDPVVSNSGMAGNVIRNISHIRNSIQIHGIVSDNKIIKRRYVDKRYNTIVFREDINNQVSPIKNIRESFLEYNAVVISDYNKGFLTAKNYKEIRERYKNIKIFADTKRKITPEIASCVDYLKINSTEYSAIENKQEIIDLCDIIVTRGEQGADLYTKDSDSLHFPTSKIEVRDVCGAGDTFLAGLVIRYLETRDIHHSIAFANECAGKVVKKFGVSVP
jgi:bifunctional ADP-heptose synthase (sugar kinase/adenylyltransferase)